MPQVSFLTALVQLAQGGLYTTTNGPSGYNEPDHSLVMGNKLPHSLHVTEVLSDGDIVDPRPQGRVEKLQPLAANVEHQGTAEK